MLEELIVKFNHSKIDVFDEQGKLTDEGIQAYSDMLEFIGGLYNLLEGSFERYEDRLDKIIDSNC